jgi:excinuclease ABC subunit A
VRFGELTGVCGPSGSGKSTLVLECFVPAMRGEKPEGRWKRALGAQGGGRRVVLVDAAPIGRTPASIPATAAGLMDPLRELFERTPEARLLGLTAASFSFNSPKGRCPACEGRGAIQVEMQFLADLWLTCEECEGRRYRPEVLAIKYRGRSIADVLDLSISEAREFLAHQPSLARILGTLEEVGLGYLGLGQSSTTLSGGEAQRIKLASELLRAEGSQGSVLVLDEPSTGLHAVDLVPLVAVLQRLAERGDAVVVIEHHTGLLAACDRLVELGPAGGAAGGRLVAQGSVAELARDPNSLTGRFLEVRRERVETAASLAPRGRRRAAPESAAEAGAEPRAAGSARTAQAKAAVPAAGSGRGRAAAKAGPKSAPKSAAKTATKAAAKPAAKAATKSVPKAVASSAVKTAGGAAPAPRRGPKGRAKPGGGGRP